MSNFDKGVSESGRCTEYNVKRSSFHDPVIIEFLPDALFGFQKGPPLRTKGLTPTNTALVRGCMSQSCHTSIWTTHVETNANTVFYPNFDIA